MDERSMDAAVVATEDVLEESGKRGKVVENEEEHVSTRKKRREKKLKSQPKSVTLSGAPDSTGPPRGICITDFVQARALELHNMTAAISQHGSTRRTFQTLPRHMRRRSMSHNIKRLPRHLREQAKNEVVESVVKKTSRKTCRKSYKLVEEYGRRSDKCRWLESHIWHAKRFKMMEYHGYKIAETCCDKGARATYRYMRTGCLLYDLSYYGCVELYGSQIDIIEILRPLMSKQVGTSVEAKDCISGCRSGDTILYHSHSYPNHAIGPVQFLWRPEDEGMKRQLWLLVDPSITNVLTKEIDVNMKSLATSGNVIVTNMKDELVHYKLIGPQSNDVIVQTVHPVWSSAVNSDGDEGRWWMTKHLALNDAAIADKKKFFEYLSCTKTPAEFPNKIIVGATVTDFRFSMLDKTPSPTVHDITSTANCQEIVTPTLPQSCIWDKAIRQCVSVVPDHQLNRVRSDRLHDTTEQLKELEFCLPLLLLHQTVSGVGVGWDILVPTGWGKSLWLSLVYHGARAVGFEEIKQCHLEQLILHYPTDFPDTDTGHQLELHNLKVLQTKYCKYPPDKRPNFGKLRSLSPFLPVWSSVIGCHSNGDDSSRITSTEEQEIDKTLPVAKKIKLSIDNSSMEKDIPYYVLRSAQCILSLSNLLNHLKTVKKITSQENWSSLLNDMQLSIITVDHSRSLVAVSFVMCHRGNPSARSMLCIPSAEDLSKLSNDETYYGPVESLNKKGVCFHHNDNLIISTTTLSNKKFKIAKREVGTASKSQAASTVEDCSSHQVHLPGDSITTSLGLQPLQVSRTIIGYSTNAGYIFSQGLGGGVGFCSLLGLMSLMKFCYLHDHPVTVLVREPDSLQYRFANVDILQNQF